MYISMFIIEIYMLMSDVFACDVLIPLHHFITDMCRGTGHVTAVTWTITHRPTVSVIAARLACSPSSQICIILMWVHIIMTYAMCMMVILLIMRIKVFHRRNVSRALTKTSHVRGMVQYVGVKYFLAIVPPPLPPPPPSRTDKCIPPKCMMHHDACCMLWLLHAWKNFIFWINSITMTLQSY